MGRVLCFLSVQNKKFSDFVDKQTGYKTKCMMTFPLMAEKECLGVVMALNKIGADAFSAEDEKVRNTFSECSLSRAALNATYSLHICNCLS